MRFLCPALFFVVLQNSVAACVIQGTTSDSVSGKPLPITKVFARPRTGPTRAAVLRVTNADGTFCFDRLNQGGYDLIAERPGYLDYLYGARPGGRQGTPLQIASGVELPALTLKLVPAAAISGTVFDTEGQPVEGAGVELLRKVWDDGWSTEILDPIRNTDDRGIFRFPSLAPGSYYLKVDPNEDGAFLDVKGQPVDTLLAPTFYGGSFTVGAATPIPLVAGQEITNVSVNIGRVIKRHLSGRVIAPQGAKMPRGLELLEMSGDDFSQISVSADGVFSAEGLLPTRYKIRPGGPQSPASEEVDLTSGDVDGFIVESAVVFEVRLSVRVEGGAPLGELQIAARAVEGKLVQDAQGQGDGTYRFRGLPAGLHRIEMEAEKLYLKSLMVDGKAASDARLDLRKGQPRIIEAVLSPNVAIVEGHTDQTPGELGATAVLLDQGASKSAPVDQAGNFTLESLAPGKYRVLVIQGFEEDLWGSPELSAVLKPRSIEFEVHESETTELVAPVISSDEWAAALSKVGL